MMRVHTVTVTSCYTVYALPPTNIATLTTLLYTDRLVIGHPRPPGWHQVSFHLVSDWSAAKDIVHIRIYLKS